MSYYATDRAARLWFVKGTVPVSYSSLQGVVNHKPNKKFPNKNIFHFCFNVEIRKWYNL